MRLGRKLWLRIIIMMKMKVYKKVCRRMKINEVQQGNDEYVNAPQGEENYEQQSDRLLSNQEEENILNKSHHKSPHKKVLNEVTTKPQIKSPPKKIASPKKAVEKDLFNNPCEPGQEENSYLFGDNQEENIFIKPIYLESHPNSNQTKSNDRNKETGN
jgi:hypothetical protein